MGQTHDEMDHNFPNRRLHLLVLLFAGFAVYGNTLDVPFYFDDLNSITQNQPIHLQQLTADGLIDAAFQSDIATRPVANVSFALNYYFNQLDPAGYHIVNILIHLTNGLLVYFLIAATLTTPVCKQKHDKARLAAFFCALLWLVHPLQVQSVTYIVQRMNSLCVLFYLSSFLLFIKSCSTQYLRRKLLLLCASVILWVLALGSKEIAVTLPFFALLYYWYFFTNLARIPLPKLAFSLLFLFMMVAVFVRLYLGDDIRTFLEQNYAYRDFNLTQRLLTQPRVVLHYLSLIIYPNPSRLHLDYDFPLSTDLFTPPMTLAAILAILTLFFTAVFAARRHRLLSFALLWFLGGLVLESSVIALEMVYEHRTYLPMIFLFTVPVVAILQKSKKTLYPVSALLVVAVLFSFWSHQRNTVWKDPILFWRHNIQLAPQKPRPYSELGMVYAERNNFKEAERYFSKSIEVDPNYAAAYNNLGILMTMINDLEAATIYFRQALRITPSRGSIRSNLGRVLVMQGDAENAIVELKKATHRQPDGAKNFYFLGLAYLQLGDPENASRYLAMAMNKEPGNMQYKKLYQISMDRLNLEE
jgi:tetratricopeptide (TPR) repeat protein